MKTVLYHVSTKEEKWKEKVVADFRWICTSGLFKKCDKLRITINDRKTDDILSGEEWVRYFWGRVDDKKVEIQTHLQYNESDVLKWVSLYPDDEIIYVGMNGELNC